MARSQTAWLIIAHQYNLTRPTFRRKSSQFQFRFYMPSVPTVGSRRHCVFWLAVCLLTPISHDTISLVRGGIWLKLGTNIHHVMWHCWKGFQGQRSKVKVTCVHMCESQICITTHPDTVLPIRVECNIPPKMVASSVISVKVCWWTVCG